MHFAKLKEKIFKEKWDKIYILCNFCLISFTILLQSDRLCLQCFHSVFYLEMLMKWHWRSFVYTIFVCQETINSPCPAEEILQVNLTSLSCHWDVFDPLFGQRTRVSFLLKTFYRLWWFTSKKYFHWYTQEFVFLSLNLRKHLNGAIHTHILTLINVSKATFCSVLTSSI